MFMSELGRLLPDIDDSIRFSNLQALLKMFVFVLELPKVIHDCIVVANFNVQRLHQLNFGLPQRDNLGEYSSLQNIQCCE